MKKILKMLFGIVCSICIIIGGYKLMKQIEYNQMVEIVKSDEVKEIIEISLKEFDPNAFTKEGKIKSYMIDEKSIKYNPMGGIDFEVYLNSDRHTIVYYGLEKDIYNNNEKIVYSGGGYSKEVKELLGNGE